MPTTTTTRCINRALLAAAQQLRLSDIEQREGELEGPRVCACSGPLTIELDRYHRLGMPGTRIRIAPTRQNPEQGLTVCRKGREMFGPEPDLGDPAFTDEFHLEGPTPLALAVLDAETRRQLGRLVRGMIQSETGKPIAVRAALRNDVLEVRVEHTVGMTGAQITQLVVEVLGTALAVVRRLNPRGRARRIAENLQSETEPGVRLQSVLLLAREHSDDRHARAALLAACQDADDRVRLAAALARGDKGTATLLALAAEPATEDSCAARAVAALGERLPDEQAGATLRQALEWRHDETAQACIEILGNRGRGESESLLLTALRHDAPQVVLAAVHALGRTGTARAIAPLHAVDPPLRYRELHAAVRQAVAEIQARLTGAKPGQLSLPEREEGALSFPAAEPGRLSLPAAAAADGNAGSPEGGSRRASEAH